jgi:hypothetical protein
VHGSGIEHPLEIFGGDTDREVRKAVAVEIASGQRSSKPVARFRVVLDARRALEILLGKECQAVFASGGVVSQHFDPSATAPPRRSADYELRTAVRVEVRGRQREAVLLAAKLAANDLARSDGRGVEPPRRP